MPNQTTTHILSLALGAALLLSVPLSSAAQPATTRVSVSSGGIQGNKDSKQYNDACISGNGRYTAFTSSASNLVSGDTNNKEDVFVHDRQTGNTTRVSVASDGTQANGHSSAPVITPDGLFIAFDSDADNLVTGDTNHQGDVFLHNRETGQTTLVSISTTGGQGDKASYSPSISEDGRLIAFESKAGNMDNMILDFNNSDDIYVRDRQTGKTTMISKSSDKSPGNSYSYRSAISGDGHSVVFASKATNLVTNSDTNNDFDIFVRNLLTGTTTLVSVNADGHAGNLYCTEPAISHDGRFVVFTAYASDLVANDTNNKSDILVRDLAAGETTRISLDTNGNELKNDSFTPSISANGRYVSFTSLANFNNTIFHLDRSNKQMTLVSTNDADIQGNNNCDYSAISADGSYVSFFSYATNLVSDDTNNKGDVFARGPLTNFPWPMFLPAITENGKK